MNFEVHLIGVWVAVMIVHGAIVDEFGDAFQHLPMYIGLVIAVIILIRRQWSPLPMGISVVYFCLLILMLLSGITGIDPDNSNYTIILYLKGFLLAVMIGGVIKNVNQIKVITLYFLCGIIYGIYEAFRQHLTGEYVSETEDISRVSSLGGDSNDTAMLLLAGVSLSIYWLTHSKALYAKLFFTLCLICNIGAIVLTGSRGGSVSLIVIIFAMFIKKPSLNVAVIGTFAIAFGLLVAPSGYLDRMESLVTGEKKGSSLNKRANFVRNGLKIFSDNPILGVGPGNYGKALHKMDTEVLIRQHGRREHPAHNMYLEFFVENGVICGMFFLIMLSYPLISLIKLDKSNADEFSVYGFGFCLAASLFALLFAGLFLSQAKNSVLWFFVGIGIASSVISKANRINSA